MITGAKASTAKFLDGQSPVATPGDVYVYGTTIEFRPSGGDSPKAARSYPLATLLETAVFNGVLHVSLPDPEDSDRTIQLLIDDLTLRPLIQRGSVTSKFSAARVLVERLLALPLLLKLAIVLLCVPLIAAVVLHGFEYGHHFVPLSQDQRLGEIAANHIRQNVPVCTDRVLTQMLNEMVSSLQQDNDQFSFKVGILKNEQNNAVAFPGGNMFFLGGLLAAAESPDEVLAILAHEMAHVERRHGMRKLAKALGVGFMVSVFAGAGISDVAVADLMLHSAGGLLVLKHSREFEAEADQDGVRRLHQAGYSAKGFKSFFDRLATQRLAQQKEQSSTASHVAIEILDWVSTHPTHEARVELLAEAMAAESKKEVRSFTVAQPWNSIRNRCLP